MFVTQERRYISALPWLGAQENILGSEAHRWLQYPLSFERIKMLLQNSEPKQLFTFSAHTIYHPQFSELISTLELYKNQITLQISQHDLCHKLDLIFSLADIGIELELIISEPASLETQIALSKAFYKKINIKILVLLNRHFTARELFESLYLSPQTRISLFISKTTNTEDWLYLSPSQSAIRSEEARDCLNKLGHHDVRLNTFSPHRSNETQHEENPYVEAFSAPSVGIWTLSAIGSMLASLIQFLFVQPFANLIQVIMANDLEQTRLYWSVKNQATEIKTRLNESKTLTLNAAEKSTSRIRHFAFMFFNFIYWRLYSLGSRVMGHSLFYSTIMYWKSFRVVQWAHYIIKEFFLLLKRGIEHIFYAFRHIGFVVFNRTYWALYWFVSNAYGLYKKVAVALYWQLYGPSVRFYYRLVHLIKRPCSRLYWIIHNIALRSYYRSVSLTQLITSSFKIVYWKIYSPILNVYGWLRGKILDLYYILIRGLHFIQRRLHTIQRGLSFIYWRLYSPTLNVYGWLRGKTLDLYFALVRRIDLTKPVFNCLYWGCYNLFCTGMHFYRLAIGQLYRFIVFLYWSLQRTLMALAWPVRKIFWFSRFQYYKRIRGQAYEN